MAILCSLLLICLATAEGKKVVTSFKFPVAFAGLCPLITS